MPFVFVSRKQLEREREELRESVQKQVSTLKLEWEEWYDKFRRLYARLSKRVSDASAADAGTPTDTSESAGATGIRAIPSPRSRRGF